MTKEQTGYEYEPKSNSPFLSLKKRGDKVKIRIVSTPIHFKELWQDKETGEGKENEKFAWIVIDREDGKVKAFKQGVMIYKKIKDFAMDEDWGNPTDYDLTIERTEEQGNYYSVKPSPSKTKITKDEQEAIEEANIDLEKLFKVDDKGTATFGDGGQLARPEGGNLKDDLGDEETEINLDSIPF
jgi:hypothetical protein